MRERERGRVVLIIPKRGDEGNRPVCLGAGWWLFPSRHSLSFHKPKGVDIVESTTNFVKSFIKLKINTYVKVLAQACVVHLLTVSAEMERRFQSE